MKKGWIYAIVGVLVVGIVTTIIKINQWSKQIKYGIAEGVEILGFSGSNISVLVPMWIYNPTPFSMVASNLNLKVYFNGYPVSTIKSQSNYKIKSKDYSTYPLNVNVIPQDVLKLIAEQGTIIDEPNWLKKVDVRLLGTVTLDIGIFQIRDFEIDYTDNLKTYIG